MLSAPVARTAVVRGRWLQVRLNDSVPPYLRSLLEQTTPERVGTEVTAAYPYAAVAR